MKELDLNNIPKHIAFIIDGNGRWAKKQGKPRTFGHKKGADAVEKSVQAARKFGVKVVSIFAFSTENWKRPKEEVSIIFKIFEHGVKKILKSKNFNGICYRHLGKKEGLPETFRKLVVELEEKTKNNNDFFVNVAINYGGRDEIVRAINKIIESGKQKITIEDLHNELDTKGLPDPDFVIRTSGEERISNFMLFQIAYSELYFPKTYWPDFDEEEVKKALIEYQGRKRRYGGLPSAKK